MSKELDELRREYAENEAKLQQYQHLSLIHISEPTRRS